MWLWLWSVSLGVLCKNTRSKHTQTQTQVVKLNVLDARQFCVVCNPAVLKDGRIGNDHGARKLVQGPTSFFLQPGESLESES